MKKRLFAIRMAAFLLAVVTALGCFAACAGEKLPDDTAVTDGHTEAPTNTPETDAETEAETTPPVIWEDYVAPEGAGVTDLSVSGTKKDDGEIKLQTITYTFAPNDSSFTLKEADADGTTVTLRKGTVSVLQMNPMFQDNSLAKYQAKVQVVGQKQDAAWNVQYFGLRLTNVGGDATGKNGVWIAIRENQIGIRTKSWPETSYMTIKDEGVNFATARMLYIEDDMTTDIITVMADNDSGEKVAIAVVKIDGNTVSMYQPGEETAAITDTGVEVPGCGYFNIWLHHMTEPVYITDFSATGAQGAKQTAEDANMMNSKDVLSDTWVSVDDVGRVTDTENREVTDKKVGIFYFLWHDPNQHGGDGKIYDHTKTYYEGGKDALINVMTQGPMGFAHYWAEPYFGYYRSDDEWVIRKHTYQLVAAGIDFIFIDATNGLTYENTYETILRVWSEMRAEGHATPQIVFHCGDNAEIAPKSYTALWNNLYSTGRYEDLWFKYNGKPLIFLPKSLLNTLPEEQQNFFTVRHSWANSRDSWYKDNRRGSNCWPWADMYPQGPGLSSDRKMEQMIVMSGFWANGSFGTNGGRSYSYNNGGQPAGGNFGFDLVDQGTSGLGIGFEEQFDYAIEQDPGLIMLVGWNEWWAGRWEAGAAIGQTIANSYVVTDDNQWTRHYYVDAFNPEFSRDIEPVKGVYNDNYYYQMAQNIRDYKGSRKNLAAFGQRPIVMDGPQSQWDIVGPEFRDYEGDVAKRDAMSYVGQIHYENKSGRNDFTVAKVSKNGHDVVFYAECAKDITAPKGTNWMNLFINADCDYATGWYGYDFVLNRTQNGNTCSIQKFVNNSWEMEEVGSAVYTISGNYIQIKVDAELLGLGDTFDFKWADNSVDSGDIMQFIDQGDAAPNDRFNYRYTTVETEIKTPSALTEDMTVLKAGSYYAFAGGKMVRLDESSTKATFFGDEDHLYVPKAFATEVMGLTVSGETYNHYGIEYVDIASALEDCGKTVIRTDDMLVLADGLVEESILLTLYRALY